MNETQSRAAAILVAFIVGLFAVLVCGYGSAMVEAQEPEPVFELTLEVLPSNWVYSEVGDVITYTYKIVNTGNQMLMGPFLVSDSRIPGVTCQNIAWGSPTAYWLPPDPQYWITCYGYLTILPVEMLRSSITSMSYAEGSGIRSNYVWTTVWNANPGPRRIWLPVLAR